MRKFRKLRVRSRSLYTSPNYRFHGIYVALFVDPAVHVFVDQYGEKAFPFDALSLSVQDTSGRAAEPVMVAAHDEAATCN